MSHHQSIAYPVFLLSSLADYHIIVSLLYMHFCVDTHCTTSYGGSLVSTIHCKSLNIYLSLDISQKWMARSCTPSEMLFK